MCGVYLEVGVDADLDGGTRPLVGLGALELPTHPRQRQREE